MSWFAALIQASGGGQALPAAPVDDTQDPTVGDPSLAFSNIGSSSYSVDYNLASDATEVTYRLYRAPAGQDLSTEAAIASNGELVSQGVETNSLFSSGMNPDTVYEHNITATDGGGNTIVYTQNAQKTAVHGPMDSQLPDTQGLVLDFNPKIAGKVVTDSTLSTTTVKQFTDSSEYESVLLQNEKTKQPVLNGNIIVPDGSDDFMEATISSFSTEFCSFFTTAKQPKSTGLDVLFSVYSTGNAASANINGLVFGFDDGRLTLWYGNGSTDEVVQESSAGNYGAQTEVGFVRDGASAKIYVSEVEAGSSTVNYSVTVNKLGLFGFSDEEFSQSEFLTLFGYREAKNASQRSALSDYIQNQFI